jgi:hypothetical protein
MIFELIIGIRIFHDVLGYFGRIGIDIIFERANIEVMIINEKDKRGPSNNNSLMAMKKHMDQLDVWDFGFVIDGYWQTRN